jgi:hypothetical protein
MNASYTYRLAFEYYPLLTLNPIALIAELMFYHHEITVLFGMFVISERAY